MVVFMSFLLVSSELRGGSPVSIERCEPGVVSHGHDRHCVRVSTLLNDEVPAGFQPGRAARGLPTVGSTSIDPVAVTFGV
jgi:hypothetical protein